MRTYFCVLAGPDFTGSIWSGGVLSTQSPECKRGRGYHKLPQPYGQPSPGGAHLLCYYSCMDIRGYDVLVVDARAA